VVVTFNNLHYFLISLWPSKHFVMSFKSVVDIWQAHRQGGYSHSPSHDHDDIGK
jgi:hypothetical protein